MNAPELPEDVLFQSLITSDNGEAGYRIYADGRYHSRPSGQGWRAERELTPQQVRRIRSIVERAGLERLDPLYRAKGVRVDDRVLWTQARIGKQAISIAIIGPVRVPEIDELSQKLLEVFQ